MAQAGLTVTVMSIDTDWNRQLFCAIDCGRASKIESLLQSGHANVNCPPNGHYDCESPLHLAVTKGFNNIVKLLLDNNADVTYKHSISGETALGIAIRLGNSVLVKLLVDYKADINDVGGFGYSAIHCACCRDNTDIVKLLLDNNANVNKAYEADETLPIHRACLNACTEIVKMLLPYNMDINTKNKEGNTPLHFACMKPALDTNRPRHQLIRLLIDNNAIVNSKNRFGETPLHIASRFGHAGIVHMLIQNGGNMYIENIREETAEDVAIEEDQDNVKDYFRHLLVELRSKAFAWLKRRKNRKRKMVSSSDDI